MKICAEVEKFWNEMTKEEREKILEKINQNSDYEWNLKFWSLQQFEKLPPMLQKEVNKKMKNFKKSKVILLQFCNS
ncbi:MAG: hypothetical protein NZ889_00845 [Candidatus Pacearchaeota archaeon]|nr:hypothetical protein [Candidatus Pacearchaeota archaeon]